ncbi:MAG: SH3 domain-containing protein [Clostridiales bacterium]|nr:SH3 domain-containing protein [Clostridiales bacterium]
MIKKFIVSFLCIVCIAGFVCAGFSFLYFSIPSRTAMNSISLPSTVMDAEQTESASTEEEDENENIYVADVYQSLTLRESASSDSSEIASLVPMTHLEVIEFIDGTDYAYVEVLTGDYEGYKGYVNSGYITHLGDATIRIGEEE